MSGFHFTTKYRTKYSLMGLNFHQKKEENRTQPNVRKCPYHKLNNVLPIQKKLYICDKSTLETSGEGRAWNENVTPTRQFSKKKKWKSQDWHCTTFVTPVGSLKEKKKKENKQKTVTVSHSSLRQIVQRRRKISRLSPYHTRHPAQAIRKS